MLIDNKDKEKSELLELAADIRDVVDNKQKELELTFVEDTHTYFIKNKEGLIVSNLPSVSTVICQFYEAFDDLTKSLDMCNNDLKLQDNLLKDWRATATYANSTGSRVHFLLETDLLKIYKSDKTVRKPIFDCNEEQIEVGNRMIDAGHQFLQLMHRRGAVLLDTEMVLGSIDLGYTGQPDKVWLMRNAKGELGFIVTDWKGLPLDTPILTNHGWRTMGTLIKGDMVYDKDGNLVNILNISKVKNKKCLKIKFGNNEEVVSDFEHRWLVYTSVLGIKKEMVMTTQEIKEYNDNLTKRDSHRILKIENAKPLNNPMINLPVDPYVLGLWLGDEHSVDAKITQANKVVWCEINNRGYEIGDDVSEGGVGKATTRTVFGLHSRLRGLSLLGNKHIPEIYLSSSYEQRLDLLRGLMDSGGTYNKTRKRFVVTTTRESQANYYVEVASSLGIKTTIITYNKKFNGKIIPCYNMEFTTTEFNPFLCRNQDIVLTPKTNKRLYRTIVSVEVVDSVPTKCIEVDSPTSTFLCGKSLLVTHNTNKPKNFETQAWTGKMKEPFDKFRDTSLEHYKIQLPLYGRLILDMLKGSKYEGIKFFGCIIVHLLRDGKFVEYRVEQGWIDITLNMNPLIRIDETLNYKKNQEIREEQRIKDYNKLING